MNLCFTGHPFVDAGVAGVAALLEGSGTPQVVAPEHLTVEHLNQAVEQLKSLYFIRIYKDEKATDKLPLFSFLLQEVLPGSSWDQAKSGSDVAKSKEDKFLDYLTSLQKAAYEPSIGVCSVSGQEAHVWIDKSKMPLLSSGGERPNCYPNLDDGYKAAYWVALAVLFAPISIEKTANDRGAGEPGSFCLIYHSSDWRFMVEAAKRNLQRLQLSISANSLKEVRYRRFLPSNKSKKCFRRGTWKIAFSTILHTLTRIDAERRPQVIVWSFNASNQSCRYDCVEVSTAFLSIYESRRLLPSAFNDVPRCSDYVSKLILEGKPIAKNSIFEDDKQKKSDRLARTTLQPGWALQRLYAEKVLRMSPRLLVAIEKAAQHLAQDNQAVNYCLYDSSGKIRPSELTGRYKMPADLAAVFADHSRLWQDYLRAAIIWAVKGKSFGVALASLGTAGALEMMLADVAPRLRQKHGYKRLAQTLSAPVPNKYRAAWIKLLNDGACTWDDFLSFNPMDEAFSFGNYYQTRIRRDYLIAYLLGLSHNSSEAQAAEGSDGASDESDGMHDDLPLLDFIVDDEMEDENE